MFDRYQREIHYLRLSVTDLCHQTPVSASISTPVTPAVLTVHSASTA